MVEGARPDIETWKSLENVTKTFQNVKHLEGVTVLLKNEHYIGTFRLFRHALSLISYQTITKPNYSYVQGCGCWCQNFNMHDRRPALDEFWEKDWKSMRELSWYHGTIFLKDESCFSFSGNKIRHERQYVSSANILRNTMASSLQALAKSICVMPATSYLLGQWQIGRYFLMRFFSWGINGN